MRNMAYVHLISWEIKFGTIELLNGIALINKAQLFVTNILYYEVEKIFDFL